MQPSQQSDEDNTKQSKQLSLEQFMSSLSLGHQIKKDMQSFEHEGYSETDVWKLGKMLQLLLLDEKLYQNNTLKQKLKASKNGWIQIEDILSIQSLQPIFQQIQLFKMISKKLITKYIHTHFTNHRSNLKTNKKSIKRRVPFIDRTKNVKPILIQNYPKDQEMSTLKRILKDVSEVYKIKWNIGTSQAYAYVQKPQEVVEFFNSQHTFQIQNVSKNQQYLKIEAQSYESFLDRVVMFRQVSERWVLKFLRRTFLRYLIKNKVEQKVKNFHQENDMIGIILFNGLFNPQLINRYQYQNNLNRQEQSYQNLDPRHEQRESANQSYELYQDPRFRPYHSKRRKNRGQLNRKINNIMQDIKTYYLPNIDLNEKFLQNFHSKSNIFNKVENSYQNQRNFMKQRQSIIDSLLQQKFTQIIQI